MTLDKSSLKEVLSIKKEIIDVNCISSETRSTHILSCVNEELIVLKEEAECQITDLLISRPEGTVKCEVLPAENNVFSSLPQANVVNEINDRDPFSCNQCSFVGISKMGLYLHGMYMHGNTKQRVRCHHCGVMIAKHRLEIHRKVHANRNGGFSCSKCNFKGTRSEIWHHRRQVHDLERQTSVKEYRGRNLLNYSCSICHLKFQSNRRLERHTKRHRIRSNYRCQNCSTFFDNVWSLEFHASSKCEQSDKIALRCPFCARTFSTHHYLEYHKRTKHVSLLSQKELAKHVIGLTCAPCNLTFSNKNDMFYHKVRFHRNILRCPHCNIFTRYLKRHIKRVHSLKCRKCSILFKTEIELDLHNLLSHPKLNSPRLPKCQYCYNTFASKSGLLYHLQNNVCRNAPVPRVKCKANKKRKSIQPLSLVQEDESNSKGEPKLLDNST